MHTSAEADVVAFASQRSTRRERSALPGFRGLRDLRSSLVSGVAVGLVAAVSVVGCGSSSSTSSATTGGGVSVAAAQAAIAPYSGHPSAFPVDKPLSKPVPAGTRIVWLQCSTPSCALVGRVLQSATKTLGASLQTVNAGSTATSVQAAAESALALHPSAVLFTGIQPSQFGDRLKQLSDAGTKVVSLAINENDVARYGIDFNYIGLKPTEKDGRLMADWIVSHTHGDANVVFYGVPAFNWSPYMQAAFTDEMRKNCPACKVRGVPINIATIGTTAPQTIVADLQAHPDTNMMAFSTADVATGVPAAMRSAGLTVPGIGFGPGPAQLQDIKNGGLTAGLASDFAALTWTTLDAAARLIVGEQPTAAEQAGDAPLQLLEQHDITFDPSTGFVAYPDVAQRFARLWHPK